MTRTLRTAGLVLLLGLLGLATYTSYSVRVQAAAQHGSAATNRLPVGTQAAMTELLTGYYDSHKVKFLNTDTSSKTQAAAFQINYSPALAGLQGAPAIYFFSTGSAGDHQPAVFGSEPGEKSYSPFWTWTNVTWKAGVTSVLLTSDNQIAALARQGKLTVHATKIILNCPIVSIAK